MVMMVCVTKIFFIAQHMLTKDVAVVGMESKVLVG